jgi:putative ABC transport system permease protein
MTGVVNQLQREPEVAVATFGGTHWIIPAGADGVFTSSATFPEAIIDSLGIAAPGRVLMARYRLADAQGANDLDVVLVGQADLPDEAPVLVDGRLAQADNEVVLSEDAGFGVGDQVRLGPDAATVTGIVAETTVFAGMPLVFVPLDVARTDVVQGAELLSALVVDDVPALPALLQALPASAVAEDALGPIERPIATMRLVQVLLAIVATLIIGAVVFLATLDRLRDVAVLRAMGVESSTIAVGVAAQALVIGLVAAVVALGIQALLAPAFPLRVHIETPDRLLLVVVSMAVAAAASYAAIRQTLRTDPAQAFGGPGA